MLEVESGPSNGPKTNELDSINTMIMLPHSLLLAERKNYVC